VETLIFRARRSLKLRASALRSLGAVPLPTSLAQLFEGGAGGGALLGTSFLAKAAVALVAGVVATGIGGGQGNNADAARGAHVAPPSHAFAHSAGSAVASTAASVRIARRAAGTVAAHASSTPSVATRGGSGAKVVPDEASSAASVTQRPSHVATGASSSSSSGGSAPAPAAPAPVTDTVASVQQTVAATAAGATSALPVQPPSLPPPPVDPPKLPPLP
jgi:hypothetical protein